MLNALTPGAYCNLCVVATDWFHAVLHCHAAGDSCMLDFPSGLWEIQQIYQGISLYLGANAESEARMYNLECIKVYKI